MYYMLLLSNHLGCDLCNPMDRTPTGSSAQSRILEWVAISFSRGSSQSRNRTHVSCIAGGFLITESLGKPMYYTLHIMNHMLISSILLCAFLVLPENFFFTWYVFISSFSSPVIQTKSLKYYRFDPLLIMFIFHLYTLLLLLLLSHFSRVRLCATP